MASVQMCCRPLHKWSRLRLLVELGESSWIKHANKLATTQQDKDVNVFNKYL